jgi:septal ring factor EnvC (AmiA/AmiB activator)
MKLRSKQINFNIFFLAAFLILLVLAADTKSQNNRRLPTPTPTPRSVAEIVSRADDIPSGNQVISPQNNDVQPGNLEDKIDDVGKRIKEIGKRVNTLESTKENEYDQTQKRLLLNLDILSRSEQRAEALRKQYFDMIEKENQIRSKLDQLESDMRPETIERSILFAGSLRPEELREQRKKTLERERTNLNSLLDEITANKGNLQLSVEKADQLVDKLRLKLEKEIDEALTDKDDN